MAKSSRARYTLQFKLEAVRMVLYSGSQFVNA